MEIQVDGVGLKKAERDNIAFFTLTPAKEVKQEQIKIEIKGPEEIQVDVFDNSTLWFLYVDEILLKMAAVKLPS